MAQTELEKFLTEKLRSEVETFGDGTTEFHTRDLQALLVILDKKNEKLSVMEYGDQTVKSSTELLAKNFEQFIKLTKQMRDAQKHYFKHRDNLNEARSLEIKVDEFIKNWN